MDISARRQQPCDLPRVFVASNVKLVMEGLHLQLGRCDKIALLGRGRLNARTAARINENAADVVVLDVGSAGSGKFARTLCGTSRAVPMVGVAIGSTRHDIADWAELGVKGFVDDSGSIEDVVDAIERVARGEFSSSPQTTAQLVTRLIERVERRLSPEGARQLTPRETQILFNLERGATNKEIARRLGISPATVKNHVHRVLEKLEVRRRQEAGAIARSGRI
ncbi:response regulator transcription factor [Roseovarius spongiae]|nr:response regulator transcription factor [Roseovarius spongiae]